MTSINTLFKLTFAVALAANLIACAAQFPRPASAKYLGSGPTGPEIFAKTFSLHGGDNLAALNDLSLSLDGEWKFLITRIQPLVTDHRYRVKSEERLIPAQGVYAAHYRGPAGEKKVFRNPTSVEVYYNNQKSSDPEVLRSTALTADAFYLFSLGPLALTQCKNRFQRLRDKQERGRRFHRLYCVLEPGIGYSQRDELVLWVDARSFKAYRMHITLEGFESTQGAHVDVTFLEFVEREGFLLPNVFSERVRGPLKITAHHWFLNGLDINRGFGETELRGDQFSGAASPAAKLLEDPLKSRGN